MIKFATDQTAPLVREMWKTCFGDSDKFLDILSKYKYRNENTLIYFDGDEAVASLQMFPYSITFYNQLIPFAYLAGLCTLPEHRKKGYMAQLIGKAHEIIAERGILLSILIPAEDWLYGFYEKYGYTQVFEKDEELIPLKDILDEFPDEEEAYRTFDLIFRYKDFCIQKTEDDFRAIVEDYKEDGYPPKSNLSGMACAINTWELLKLYAAESLSKTFSIKVYDNFSDNNIIYLVDKGEVDLILKPETKPDIEIRESLLCRLLFGYKTNEVENGKYSAWFEEHHPVMNLMLE
ncbi:MAG: GNAT family N-acetyltransferase [Prevotella sp.]|jgi:predicted acetyltransferase|nr:GNAT family N-acetyltransferase [Prevotella sp.]